MGLVQANQQEFDVRRVYFVGSNTLVAGQPLCYQEAPASSTKGYGMDVEIPNTDNERCFAGIVAASSVGVTGPNYIDIVVPRPGDILQVLCGNAADLALGDRLKLNFDIPTLAAASGGELGAFDLVYATTNQTITTSPAGSVIGNAYMKGVCDLLESVASSASAQRTLKWVQFVKNR